jgi:hypothetical protein
MLRPEGGSLQRQGQANMSNAQTAAGYVPVQPLSKLAKDRFGGADAELDWIALRVWTVINADLVTLER